MRVPSALLFSAVVPCLGGGDGSPGHQKVSRREQALPSFSRSVLGDLSALEQGPPSFLREHMFIADISVGTPPQTMKCLLDSGTADIWIPSRRCRSCEQGHHFHADKSETFMPAVARTDQGLMPVPVRMDYKSGEVVGFLVQDTIGLGWVEVKNQSFLIVEEAKLPDHREWDGICGLGWHRMAAEGTGQPLYRHFQPMHHNMQQRADVKPIFSLVPAPDRQAYIVVGEVPEAAMKEGTLAWLQAEPLVEGSPKSFWAVQGTIQARDRDEMRARFVVDTASPFLFAPRDLFPSFVRALLPEGHFDQLCGADPNAGSLVVCSCDDGLDAEVWVNLGDSGFRLGSDKLFKRVPDNGGGEDLCLLAIQPNPSSSMDPMELLGDLLTGSGITQGGEPELPNDLDPEGAGQPFDMPPLPFLVPIAEALNATFTKGHAGGAPITVPAADGSLQNLMPLLPPIAGEEQVEEIVEMKPDGTSCTTTLVWDAKGLKRNSTECSDGTQAEKRRLSDSETPNNLWVLGGPFLEHFVTVMDFENSRIGFAQPVGQESAQLERAIQVSNPNLEVSNPNLGAATPVRDAPRMSGAQEGQPPGPADAEDPDAHAGGFPWGTLVLLACLGTAACFFYRVQQKTKRRKNLAFDDMEDPARPEEEAVAAE